MWRSFAHSYALPTPCLRPLPSQFATKYATLLKKMRSTLMAVVQEKQLSRYENGIPTTFRVAPELRTFPHQSETIRPERVAVSLSKIASESFFGPGSNILSIKHAYAKAVATTFGIFKDRSVIVCPAGHRLSQVLPDPPRPHDRATSNPHSSLRWPRLKPGR